MFNGNLYANKVVAVRREVYYRAVADDSYGRPCVCVRMCTHMPSCNNLSGIRRQSWSAMRYGPFCVVGCVFFKPQLRVCLSARVRLFER